MPQPGTERYRSPATYMGRPNPTVAVLVIASLLTGACAPGVAEPDVAGANAPSQNSQARPDASRSAAAAIPAETGPPDQMDPPQIDDVRRELDPALYSVDAAAAALGSGVVPAFEFVRDRIGFEAYSGALRGAGGTLAHGAGNATDRALLLSDLLRRKGFSTRFVIGRVDAARAAELYDRLFPIPRAADVAHDVRPAAGPFAEDPLLARVYARALRDQRAMLAALGETRLPRASMPEADVLREIAAHVWLQAQVDGTWMDLDPSLQRSETGRALGSPERTVADLPPELWQQVAIRVSADVLSGTTLSRQVLLESTFTAEAVVDRQVFLFHVPGTGTGGLAGAIEDAATGPDAWAPVLWVAGDASAGKPIVMADGRPGADRASPPAGGLGSLFGAGGALTADRPQFVTEWLEIELRTPDGSIHDRIRRPLIDRAGEAWRRARRHDAASLRPLARDADGAIDPRRLHNIWFSAGRHDLAAYADAAADLASIASSDAGAAPPANLPFETAVWPFALHNASYFIVSDHALVPSLNDSQARRFYPDAPRVLIVSAGLRQEGAETVFSIEYDLARNDLRAVVSSESAEAGAVARKLWFGALEGALEHELGQRYAAAGRLRPRAATSTSGSLGEDGAILVEAASSTATFEHADSEAVARRQLAAGAILIVPRAARAGPMGAWWSIDRRDADVRAMLGNGGGAIMNSYDIWGRNPAQNASSGAHWDLSGRRHGSRYGVQRTPERRTAPHEYLMMIANLSVAVVLSVKLMVAFYQEVLVPTFAGQVVSTLETGVAADRQHRRCRVCP